MDLSGQPQVDQVTLLDEQIVRVRCRWCGADDGVVQVPRPEAEQEPGLGGTP